MRRTPYKFSLLPVPYEATTSYSQGTRRGPAAILAALPQVEEFDYEFGFELPQVAQINVWPALPVKNCRRLPEKVIRSAVAKIIRGGQTPVALGGEHAISAPVVAAIKAPYQNLSVLQFDAHADLRNTYQGRKDSHACAARRILEVCPNVVQVGIRNISKEEYAFAQKTGQIKKIHFIDRFTRQNIVPRAVLKQILSQLSDTVYITFDVDALDPSEMPSTGTPEPGGLRYNQVIEIIRAVTAKKKVVGFDLVELSPLPRLLSPNFLAARLLCKIAACICAAK